MPSKSLTEIITSFMPRESAVDTVLFMGRSTGMTLWRFGVRGGDYLEAESHDIQNPGYIWIIERKDGSVEDYNTGPADDLPDHFILLLGKNMPKSEIST